MYNRYIPQPDGSYRRSQIQDPQPHEPPRQETRQPEHRNASHEPERTVEQPKTEQPRKKAPPCTHMRQPRPYRAEKQQAKQEESHTPYSTNVTGFLRQLLPKDFDTGDLLIVILLLLMSGDCAEDQNTALLTLALYFFM